MKIGITRRGFFQAFGGLIASSLFGFGVLEKEKKIKRYLLCEDYVAGVAYYDFAEPEEIETLWEGAPVFIKREPENPHDPRAIEVFAWDGRKIGYMPRHANRIPAKLMDQDADLVASVIKLGDGEETWRAVKMRLELVVKPA
ncbi:MAG: HIRAN domain-containing protein [Actinobacteria bacterium]|nr:HIRAN domain-containing protein [Actinomycetota bacterium]